MMGEGKSPIEKFDENDFEFWKMQIEDYLYGKNLYKPLFKKLEKMEDDEWALLDRKAMSVARLSLSRNVVLHKVKVKSTREMLDTLMEMYEKPSTMNKVGPFKAVHEFVGLLGL
ncbi:hypothetical protein ACS0TY_026676 [Phlomoides rotata]